MSFLVRGWGGQTLTHEQKARQQQRETERHARTLERKNQGLVTDEQRLRAEFKNAALKGEHGEAQRIGKRITAMRKTMRRNSNSKHRLLTIGDQTAAVGMESTMNNASMECLKSMQSLTSSIKPGEVSRLAARTMQQRDKMAATQEVIDDLFEELEESDEDEGDCEDITLQLYDEMGIDLENSLHKAVPATSMQQKQQAKTVSSLTSMLPAPPSAQHADPDEAELMARLAKLQNDP